MKAVAGIIIVSFIIAGLSGAGRSDPLSVRTSAVDLHAENVQVYRIGRLKFLGGLDLTSSDPRFGGLSGLAVSADGTLLSAVTDRGGWVQLSPEVSPDGRLTGIAAARIGNLLDFDGKPLHRKRDADAESLTPVDGGFAVSFESRHRLWLYRAAPNPFLARPSEIALPAASRSMPRNSGLEALAQLRDGRLIVIAEDFPKGAPFAQGWFLKNDRWHGFRYRRHGLFLPVGAATLPDGVLLVLERRFSYVGGFGTRLVEISPGSIRRGADVAGREVARLERPLITGNFEGIASYRNEAGDTVLYLISDDNFFALQRTLLLKFYLEK